jgi:hypothetical protein
MAHKFENAKSLLTAVENPRRSVALSPLLESNTGYQSFDLETISRSVYDEFNEFAKLVSQTIPVTVTGNVFDTSNHYRTPNSRIMVFSLKPADSTDNTPTGTTTTSLGILEMYRTVDLTDTELAKVIIEQRPTISGHTLEAFVKSHGNTPPLITSTISGVTPIIGHPVGRPNEDYTTIKIIPLVNESPENFTDRINQAIETTAAGIISQSRELTRQARQTLALAA